MRNMMVQWLIVISILIFMIGCTRKVSEIEKVYPEEIKVSVENIALIDQEDAFLAINVQDIKENYSDFNENGFIVMDELNELPSQLKGEENIQICWIMDLDAGEKKDVTIRYIKDINKSRKYSKKRRIIDIW